MCEGPSKGLLHDCENRWIVCSSSHKQYCHHCHMDITVEIVIIRTTIKSHLCLHYLLSYLYPLFARCGRGGIGTKMESFRMIYCKAASDDG